MSEDEDKPTVVIDFDSVKAQLQADEDIVDNEAIIQEDLNLEFGSLESLVSEDSEETFTPSRSVYYFSFKTKFFDGPACFKKPYIKELEDLNQLNAALSDDPESTLIFYYNSIPKIVNQLSMQIKNKFPLTKTIIIAKNLSAQKAQQHHNSKYGANSYLNEPFKDEELLKTIQSLENN